MVGMRDLFKDMLSNVGKRCPCCNALFEELEWYGCDWGEHGQHDHGADCNKRCVENQAKKEPNLIGCGLWTEQLASLLGHDNPLVDELRGANQ